jgi:hypothetical protein
MHFAFGELYPDFSHVQCYVFRQHLASLNRKIEERERAEGKEKGFRYML